MRPQGSDAPRGTYFIFSTFRKTVKMTKKVMGSETSHPQAWMYIQDSRTEEQFRCSPRNSTHCILSFSFLLTDHLCLSSPRVYEYITLQSINGEQTFFEGEGRRLKVMKDLNMEPLGMRRNRSYTTTNKKRSTGVKGI